MMKKIVQLSFLMMLSVYATAQDTLPKISVTLLGKKALVSWVNTQKNITNINIQRSGDSLRNFTTIGSVFNVNAVSNGFVDKKEFLPNEQYYRLFITFEGGDYIFTESHRPVPDTLKMQPPEIVPEPKPKPQPEPKPQPKPKPVQKLFVPSHYVFAGKDNNVTIAVKNAKKNNYSLKVFEDDGTFLFEIRKIPEDSLIIDKSNFMHSGLFRFELYENHNLLEKHKLFIPEDGKSMPLLDENGYEIKNR